MVIKNKDDILALNRELMEVSGLANNILTTRMAFMRNFLDRHGHRDLNKDCGYPTDITPVDYLQMYEREGTAQKIVNVYPEECFALDPEVTESEDESEDTPFELGLAEMIVKHNLWSQIQQVDKDSGIGRFGLLLTGYDDGKDLSEPLDCYNGRGEVVAGAKPVNLTYLMSFPEYHAYPTAIEIDINNPRYGLPLAYNVSMVNPTPASIVGAGIESVSGKLVNVHWSRVLHVAEDLVASRTYARPRMQTNFNRLIDIRKIAAADGEGFWQGAFPGISLETQPGVEIPTNQDELEDKVEDTMKKYRSGLQHFLFLTGLTAKTLTPAVTDPTPHLMAQLKLIAMSINVPLRIFLGAEEGKLASTQDARSWNKRLARRQNTYLTPRVIRYALNRFIDVGALPRPKQYSVAWGDLNALSDADKAAIAMKNAKALIDYISGGGDQMISPIDFLVSFLGLDTSKARHIIDAAAAFEGTDGKVKRQLMKLRETLANKGAAGGAKNKNGTPKPSGRVIGRSQGNPRGKNAA